MWCRAPPDPAAQAAGPWRTVGELPPVEQAIVLGRAIGSTSCSADARPRCHPRRRRPRARTGARVAARCRRSSAACASASASSSTTARSRGTIAACAERAHRRRDHQARRRAAPSCAARRASTCPTPTRAAGADREGPRGPGLRRRSMPTWSALSFVQRPEDVEELLAELDRLGAAEHRDRPQDRDAARPSTRLPALLLAAMRHPPVGGDGGARRPRRRGRLRAAVRGAGGDPVAVRGGACAGHLGHAGARIAGQGRHARRAPRSPTRRWAAAPNA